MNAPDNRLTRTKRVWTVVELIRWTSNYLSEKGFSEARLQVEWLLAHVLRCDRVGLYLQFDRPLTSEELTEFKALLKRRLAREPLQYVLGQCEFHGLRLKIDRRALIPRPETEQLVEVVLKLFGKNAPGYVLDVGTGSGNLVLALADRWPETRFVAVDRSNEALTLAAENAKQLGSEARIWFLQADLFSPHFVDRLGRKFDLVVSNPPYVRPEEWPGLQPEIVRYEPREALVAEPDGLRFYRRFAEVVPRLLRDRGWLVVEIGSTQAEAVRNILRFGGFRQMTTYQDLAERDRVVAARIEAEQGNESKS